MVDGTLYQPPTSFFWQVATDGKGHKNTTRCSSPWSLATENPTSTVERVFPVYLTLYPIGLQPSTQLVMQDSLGFFSWDATLPVGTNFSVALTDSGSPPISGGVVDGFYIVDGGLTNCTDPIASTSPLEVEISPAEKPCDEIELTFSSGVAPYTATLLSGLGGSGNISDLPEKAVINNTISSGQTFTLAFTDANGLTSVVSHNMTSAKSPTCKSPSRRSKSTSTSTIIGAAIGGILAAILLTLLGWSILRRRSAQSLERRRRREEALKGEYRLSDGEVPLVEPFIIPTAPYTSSSSSTPMLGRADSVASSLDPKAELANPDEFGFRTPDGVEPSTPVDSHFPRI